ncbi:MAG: hypothetical protein ACOC1K_02120, partial [Nanoarchaeota archaeon]
MFDNIKSKINLIENKVKELSLEDEFKKIKKKNVSESVEEGKTLPKIKTEDEVRKDHEKVYKTLKYMADKIKKSKMKGDSLSERKLGEAIQPLSIDKKVDSINKVNKDIRKELDKKSKKYDPKIKFNYNQNPKETSSKSKDVDKDYQDIINKRKKRIKLGESIKESLEDIYNILGESLSDTQVSYEIRKRAEKMSDVDKAKAKKIQKEKEKNLQEGILSNIKKPAEEKKKYDDLAKSFGLNPRKIDTKQLYKSLGVKECIGEIYEVLISEVTDYELKRRIDKYGTSKHHVNNSPPSAPRLKSEKGTMTPDEIKKRVAKMNADDKSYEKDGEHKYVKENNMEKVLESIDNVLTILEGSPLSDNMKNFYQSDIDKKIANKNRKNKKLSKDNPD